MQHVHSFEYNSIIIIESLRDNDLKTGKILSDRLKQLHPDHEGIQHIEVGNQNDFIGVMSEIETLMSKHEKFRPIIDIEAHGGHEVIQFSDYSTMKWADLMNITRRLNKICNNELVLFIAACDGYKFLRTTTISEFSPCGYLYAPNDGINPLPLYKATEAFFNEITMHGDLDKAADLLSGMEISCFKSEIVFLNAMVTSLINDFKGKKMFATDVAREGFVNAVAPTYLGTGKEEYTKHVIRCFNDYVTSN